MNDLFLPNIDIKGFRAFRHLQIEHFGRVNLIVGVNSVGKSCLLEALTIYAQQGSPQSLRQLLMSRDETLRPAAFASDVSINDLVNDFRHLFHGRNDIDENIPSIQIGPVDNPGRRLSIDINWDEVDQGSGNLFSSVDEDTPAEISLQVEPILYSRMGYEGIVVPLEQVIKDPRRIVRPSLKQESNDIPFQFVPMPGLVTSEVSRLWDKTTLTASEDQVLAALRIINPLIERISIVHRSEGTRYPVVIVKLKGSDDRIPLKSMGEGMHRLLGLTLAAVNSKGGILMVDEIESGLHYSVQPEMWRLLFNVAETLNVQIFATTHSYDCVRHFCKVAMEHPEEGIITRLYRNNDKDIDATLYNEDEMKIIAEQQIEVR